MSVSGRRWLALGLLALVAGSASLPPQWWQRTQMNMYSFLPIDELL